jgi:hypothetical protein
LNLQLYTLLYATVGGALLTEEVSLTLSRSTGSQAVMTVSKGYAGESPGANTIELDVTNAIPAAGQEFDSGPAMASLSPVEFGVLIAGKSCVFKGFIIKDTFKHSVNAESSYDFSCRGAFAQVS